MTTIDTFAVPEPSSLVLLSLGVGGIVGFRSGRCRAAAARCDSRGRARLRIWNITILMISIFDCSNNAYELAKLGPKVKKLIVTALGG